jgi:hypothetical protein
MKATIDFDDALYRRLKVEAARRGRTIRDLVAEGVRQVLGQPVGREGDAREAPAEWFGSLHEYAGNARGHDLGTIRRSIARGRRAARG